MSQLEGVEMPMSHAEAIGSVDVVVVDLVVYVGHCSTHVRCDQVGLGQSGWPELLSGLGPVVVGVAVVTVEVAFAVIVSLEWRLVLDA